MAERRMFAKAIIDSDAFLDMPLSAQALYFHLSMRADDDGFVGNPKRIQRTINATDEDFNTLVERRYVILFESGVIVIRHWRWHNYIQADRYKETIYLMEKSRLAFNVQKAYELRENTDNSEGGSKLYPTCIQRVSKTDTQVSIGKDSIELVKDSIGENSIGKASRAQARAHAREGSAKEKFFAEFPSVRSNGADDSGVDYAALLEAFRAGNEYLRNTKSMNYITAHYAEIIGGGYRKAAAQEGAQPKANAMQLWQELMQAVERAKELRYDDYTGYDVYLYCKRDESSKKEVEEIYRALPSEVTQRYGKDNFIELCKTGADELKFERARFLKTF